VYLSDDYEAEREGAVSRYLGWTVWGFSFGTNLWATSLICIRTWYVSLLPSHFVMTRRIVQAAQESYTILNWQGNYCIHSRETSCFHGRVWNSLSVHLGMF
jgi:hypothetical protein